LNAERRRAALTCRCSVGETVVLEGEAVVKVPKRDEAPQGERDL
jgi:3-hydroxybutyryl-CoA dehydratase